MNHKIALCGCPGTGRINIAMELSLLLDIPLVSSKDMIKSILMRDGYQHSSNSFVELFLADKKRELELINHKIYEESLHESFVTDRSTLENFAYALLRVESYTQEDINALQELCKNNMNKYSTVVYFPRVSEIEENGLRTVNVFFQQKIDYIIQGLLTDWQINYIRLPVNSTNITKTIMNRINGIRK